MRQPIVSFHGYLLGKILTYLKTQGCQAELSTYTLDGVKSTIQDDFGFRYEIQIKTIGRVPDNLEGSNANVSKTNAVVAPAPRFKG